MTHTPTTMTDIYKAMGCDVVERDGEQYVQMLKDVELQPFEIVLTVMPTAYVRENGCQVLTLNVIMPPTAHVHPRGYIRSYEHTAELEMPVDHIRIHECGE